MGTDKTESDLFAYQTLVTLNAEMELELYLKKSPPANLNYKDIKQIYRKASRKFHPDKTRYGGPMMLSLGAPKEILDDAVPEHNTLDDIILDDTGKTDKQPEQYSSIKHIIYLKKEI